MSATATMSKKDRKALRKQLVEKKKELLAKRNNMSAANKPNLPADLPTPGRGAYSASLPKTVAPKPSTPSSSRHVAWPQSKAKPLSQISKRETPKRRALAKTAATTVTDTPAPRTGSTSRWSRTRQAKPVAPAVTAEPFVQTAPMSPVYATAEGPGPLQRGAAAIEAGCRKVRRGVTHIRQWLKVEPDEASAYGSLPGVVWPLRLCGLVSVVGAVALAIQAESMVALTLGFGLGIAVIQLALAEIARAVWGLIREG